jgi:hypothetical protein
MKKKSQRKSNSLAVKLQSVRNSMAQDLNKAYKMGSTKNCEDIGNGLEDNTESSKIRVEKRKHYCTANFAENYAAYQNCLDTDDFCQVCCDNEFGEFYLNERESCYKKSCDHVEPQKELKQDLLGKWIWQTIEKTA